MNSLTFLNDREVAGLLTPAVAVEAIKKALAAHAAGAFQMPLKVYTRPGGRENEHTRGRFIAMPASVGGAVNAVGMKWIASVPANVAKGIDRASGLVILNDPETGHPIAVMECATLSARRTGAVAAVVFEHLGVSGQPVAIFGAGPISKEVMTTIALTGQSVGEFRIFDPDKIRASRLAEYLNSEMNISASFVASPEAALSGSATVICSTTGAKEHIRKESLTTECRLMFPLSLDDFSEDAVLTADRIVCDDFDQCNREEKVFHHLVQKGKITRSSIYAQLSEIITGLKPGRQNQERYFVNAMGLAIEDVAVARAVLTLHNQKQTKQ